MSARRQEANAVRWTPNRIRKALLCPKPEGAAGAALRYEHGTAWRGQLGRPTELELLRYIADHGDLVHAPIADEYRDGDPRSGGWLLVALPAYLLEALESLDADLADLEVDEDLELDGEGDDSPDNEPDLGASDNLRQLGWALNNEDREADDADFEGDGCDEPNIANPNSWVRMTSDLESETVRRWREGASAAHQAAPCEKLRIFRAERA